MELWAAIPAGFALRLNPLVIGLASSSGAICSVFLVIVIGENIRKMLLKSVDNSNSSRGKLLKKIWDSYGIIGLGIFSPLLFGAPVGAAIGVALGAPRKRLFLWMTVGIVLWTIILVITVIKGTDLFL